ncbi:MAG: pyridoxal-phosphate dependent enzyme, partial [Chloroflexi bacterium]|nr:pyridoxal-phosphate dependent enzyme [Chloroflexota bacterium]
MVSTLAPVVAGRPGGNDGRTRINGLACRECGDTYEIAPIHVCSRCFGPLEVQYDYDLIRETVSRETIARGPDNMWRYRDLLPLDGQGNNLWLKNDAVNPTYSFKDRVVAVASAKAKEFGFDTFACASTGNLASAVAAAGVRLGLNTYVFLPQNTERAKFLNAQVYGANVIAIDGTYDDVNRLCSEIADQRGWAFCNINVRPYYSEGSKTLAFEVAEQLGWEVPDHLVIPIASGSLLVKITKGFNELAKIGLTNGKSF